jgi:hypothetical protein
VPGRSIPFLWRGLILEVRDQCEIMIVLSDLISLQALKGAAIAALGPDAILTPKGMYCTV